MKIKNNMHDNAAGCSIRNADLDELHCRANRDLAQYNFGEDYYEVEFERQALSDDLTRLIYDLAQYKAVWSQQNNEPYIYVKDLHFSKKDMQIMGRNADTIKIVKNGVAYMKFFAKDLIEKIESIEGNNLKMEVVGKANLNVWMGNITPQIFVEQIQVEEDSILDF